MAQFTTNQIDGSDTLDHLGLVAATIEKLGLVPMIDKLIPVDHNKGAKTTMGQRVAAMILNGLGFIDDRLYMFPQFLSNKPVEKLLGEGLLASDFNDDALGRCLDSVYSYGVTRMYSELALPIGLKHKVINRSSHVDTTTLSVYGDYDEDVADDVMDTASVLESSVLQLQRSNAPGINLPLAQPKYGHAKNKRNDLKQMTLLLATSGKAGFPVWMEAHHGSASDKKTLQEAAQRMQKFCNALELAPSFLHVGDSAMYLNCVDKGDDLLWLSRVPESLKLAKTLITQREVDWTELDNGYKIYGLEQSYKNVAQRWLLVFSEHAYNKEIETLDKNISKEHVEVTNKLWHLSNAKFCCNKDAKIEINKLQKTLRYHSIEYTLVEDAKYSGKGRPKKDAIADKIEYKISATIVANSESITNAKLTKGRFILATNADAARLSYLDMLPEYKEQSKTECGFKFIKDDAFELDSVFLKKPERINALMMIMTLCLMVYSFAEYFLRQQLIANNETIPLQTGRLSNKPSMKWVYRLLLGVHVLKIKVQGQVQQIILNLNDLRRRIIGYFGEVALKIYDIESTISTT